MALREPTICEKCGKELQAGDWPFCGGNPNKHVPAHVGVIGDDIPGGIWIRHFENEPMKFYSKTEIKRAANERGLTWGDDTPKPYKVQWSGRTKEDKE